MAGDVHAGVLSSVSITKATYPEQCVTIAKDFLQGYYEDYYFFQYDVDTWVLLYDFDGDYSISPAGFSLTSGSCSVFEIDRAIGGTSSKTGHITGALVGDDTQVFTNCDISLSEPEYSYYTYVISYSGNISVSSSGRLAYGSVDSLPHLIEGVENYAFAAFAFALGVVAFRLCDRLFRRIY